MRTFKFTGEHFEQVVAQETENARTRLVPLGVKCMPPATRVYSNLKPSLKNDKICKVLHTNTQLLCPVSSRAFYQAKTKKGQDPILQNCTVLKYNDYTCKVTILVGDSKKTVGQEFVRPISILFK